MKPQLLLPIGTQNKDCAYLIEFFHDNCAQLHAHRYHYQWFGIDEKVDAIKQFLRSSENTRLSKSIGIQIADKVEGYGRKFILNTLAVKF